VRNAEEDDDQRPRSDDPARLLFRPLEPFLAESNYPVRPGQIRRASLPSVWQWLSRDGAPAQAREFEQALSQTHEGPAIAAATRKFQLASAEAIGRLATPAPGADRQRAFGDSQIASVTEALNVPSLQTPQLLPFTLSLVMQRLGAPWQIIRLAIKMAASDDEIRVAATPYGVAVTIALHDLSYLAAILRTDIRRGHFDDVGEQIKALHDGLRGLRTELDLRNDSSWGRQLTAIRADISNSLQSEIETVPGRARRLLRQRADKDISAAPKIDPTEVEEVAALIDFVAVCRTYASELAINEVTLRTYSDHDYASLMSRAAENAVTGERKSSRAG
jgi:hypothetical protein